MAKLNRDVLYLISKELQDNKKTLNSCLLVNKTWSEIFIPTLWKNPWKDLVRENEILLFDIIISHLSNDLRDNLIQYFNFLKKNRKFTHLYIPHRFDHQIHLIPDAKCCFLELQFLCCHTTIDDNILNGLTEICKSIKELELFIGWTNNKYGIIKLIENQKELSDIRLNYYYSSNNESFFKILITSLIKFSNNIQYFTSKSLSLPFFQVFGAVEISAKSLTSLIENTSGNLIEIKIAGIYKAKGIIKRYDNEAYYEDFEWIKKKV
ncbi:hypothetical protein GLOIN_2v1866985 [Rhizophagus irregularis DAOM 181602=DAOM 197198]|nr:hypothetical protein GLOIN_2v1866985 [Rhizophagus irregularis DAOM 181602=DAOM 197198]